MCMLRGSFRTFLAHMGTDMKRVFIICTMYLVLLAINDSRPGTCSAQNVSAFFIFGDSMVDVGNNFYIDTTIAKPSCPNGVDFARGCPSGRYTNARTVADIIEEELGFKDYSPPYLSPNTTGDVILKGVNYASSGSGILNTTGVLLGGAICMDEQITQFSKTRQDIISRLGASAARQLLTRAIYFVGVGSNDILHPEASKSRDTYLDNLFSKFKSQLTTLYNLDGRKIIVTNVPAVGCIPFARDWLVSRDKCVDFVNEVAKTYDTRLKNLLAELTANLTGSTFVYVDVHAMFENILQNYESYGFKTAVLACCQVIGEHGGLLPCGAMSRYCSDRSKYVFWDPFHLTETANLILAKNALDGDINYVSPINIRQLANS